MNYSPRGIQSLAAAHVHMLGTKIKFWIHLFIVTEESVSESQNIYVNMVYKCIQFKTKHKDACICIRKAFQQ